MMNFRKLVFLASLIITSDVYALAENVYNGKLPDGTPIIIDLVGHNAARVRVGDAASCALADEYIYGTNTMDASVHPSIGCNYNSADCTVSFVDQSGNEILTTKPVLLDDSQLRATLTFAGAPGEALYGTGQFQDGYLDVSGLSRRLTQVNTQISVPMIISSAGYGILWNQCGLTEWNPGDSSIALTPADEESETVSVNVTSTTGGKQEKRSTDTYTATIDIAEDGDYSLLLDCGQKMARKHYLEVDGEVLTRADNVWLPPTTSVKTHLSKGKHHVVVKGDKNDTPTLHWKRFEGTNTFASPADVVDYTVFVGSPDQVVAQMRRLTGEVPMLPKWAFGYVHCRERYDTQAELLENAREFRARQIPVDVIVQDWQWWGSNGWNAMKFDSVKYPDPKAMTDSLHDIDMRLMLSVWAKVDKNSELGHQLQADSCYIPDTDWIDFFSADAAEAYWQAYRENLLPTGIDAWWQDATEPENDDLHRRTVGNGKICGDDVRNVFPIVVNDRVYKGLCEERPDQRPMILTRSGAPGIQRYGVVTWSGDVGNDWTTLERQIKGGLGQSAAGLPWWTYDAGGFFRPAAQYDDADYQRRMVRWIQTAVFLPIMRVHGYMSQTEPWHYSPETYGRFIDAIRLRYSLIPYIYSEARRVTSENSTLMRPLVFDFANDTNLPKETTQYMLGRNLLVCPVVSDAAEMTVYLPLTPGGWYDIFTGKHFPTAGYTTIQLSDEHIPVFAKAGTVLPWLDSSGINSTADIIPDTPITLKVYPGADGKFTLYDDDGVSQDYQHGVFAETVISWDDTKGTLDFSTWQQAWSGYTPVAEQNTTVPLRAYPASENFEIEIVK